MSILALAMIVGSAALHVLWNALVKTCHDKVSFAFLSTGVGTALALVLFALSRVVQPGPLTREVLVLAMVSGLIESLYILTLFAAYRHVDLSVVYPLSRGAAPLLGAIPAVLLVGDTLTAGQLAGVVMVSAGVLAVSVSAARGAADRAATRNGIALALLTAALIAGYHVVDRRAMTLEPPPATLEYFALMHLWLFVFISAGIAVIPAARKRALTEWKANWRGVLTVGLLSVLAYLLIMGALRIGNVTLVAASRNVGIVISTVVGTLMLHERVDRLRIAGAAVILSGIMLFVLLQKPLS